MSTQGSFLNSVGLVEINQTANNNWNDAGDIAVTFTSPTGTFNEANFEARLQYDLRGTASGDTITTGGLDDTITGGAGIDTIDGGAGIDTIRFDQPTLTGNHDIVNNYSGSGANRDILDISLLVDAAFGASNNNVNDFVRIVEGAVWMTTLQTAILQISSSKLT